MSAEKQIPTIEEFIAGMPQGMGVLNDRMGIELLEISPERVVATMPVEGNTQPYGLLHGGASVVLAETLGSVGSGLHAHPDRFSVGVDINATHHRSATSGTVTGVATAIHLGRTSASYEVVITDEAGAPGVHLADHLRVAARGPLPQLTLPGVGRFAVARLGGVLAGAYRHNAPSGHDNPFDRQRVSGGAGRASSSDARPTPG